MLSLEQETNTARPGQNRREEDLQSAGLQEDGVGPFIAQQPTAGMARGTSAHQLQEEPICIHNSQNLYD